MEISSTVENQQEVTSLYSAHQRAVTLKTECEKMLVLLVQTKRSQQTKKKREFLHLFNI